MNKLKEKYIELLLNKCIFPRNKKLFISYDKSNRDFITNLVRKAKEMGFEKILLDDIDSEKINIANENKIKYQSKYFESVMNDSISWTIFVLSNKIWAESLFPNDVNSYEKLEKLIFSFYLINDNNVLDNWDNYILLYNLFKVV